MPCPRARVWRRDCRGRVPGCDWECGDDGVSLDVPVLLVIYRRPEATRRVFEAIARAKPQRLLIAADGAATSADREACDATRAVVSRIDWDCEVTHDFSQENLGLNRRM